MFHHWLIIAFSWFGSVSLQYINTGGPRADIDFEAMDSPQYPIPSANSAQMRTDFESLQIDPLNEQFYQRDDVLAELQRKRRMSNDQEPVGERERRWAPNLVNSDKAAYLQSLAQMNPYVIGISRAVDENVTANDILETMMQKKYFSPWGGKRDKAGIERMWTWKRGNNLREPNMPKRVRFSPWGGKRSGQMVFKPGAKNTKIIFSTSIPELTRIVSKYAPGGKLINIAGFEFIPMGDKRNPINIVALSTKLNGRSVREAMPFKSFIEVFPKFFKPGHPYADVNLKTDGKRKVKFSAWGGKRSPPIIGPIWTPANQNMKDTNLNTIVLLEDKEESNMMSKAS